MPIIDEFSRFVTVYFLTSKDEAVDALLECIQMYKTQRGSYVQTIQADNGGEFTSNYLKNELKKKGITLQMTIPYTSQQNGVAERMNRTLVDRARTMMIEAGLATKYWQHAMSTAAHVTNRIPSAANGHRSPYELWTGQLPELGHLRVFGCRAYVHVPDERRRKFDAKAVAGIFLGYATGQKGYVVQDSETGKILTSRDVTFDENHLPAKPVTPPLVWKRTRKRRAKSTKNGPATTSL